ncbi:asparagine synthetase domain-containing protein C4F6.11c isoform X2 [Magnolia sinica]|uniref:asparagine synthetase domain-containing protein C4F6.11c isoform X2 n=1 Tax=Magnolia sinica TaxID=86752 RepID=UPI00265885A2|nr:asparagine synthetase domain-containing protein C4F6.11c isoform X2 [Magnolia sinica]
MCGIALIISGVRIDSSSFCSDACLDAESHPSSISEAKQVDEHVLLIDDLKGALLRRGPDHLGSKRVLLKLKSSKFMDKDDNVSALNVESVECTVPINCDPLSHCLSDELRIEGPLLDSLVDNEEDTGEGISCLCFPMKEKDGITHASEVVCTQDVGAVLTKSVAELHFLGAMLQLRGTSPVLQPLVDTSGNLLVYNGEIFGGINVGSDSNDGETLMHELEGCCHCDCHRHGKSFCCIEKGQTSVPMLLSTIKGPWALIYWQARSKIIWFGRDAFGRRSLLVHWPTLDDPQFLLSSVSPPSSVENSDFEVADEIGALDYWEELPCGIYSICFDASIANSHRILVGQVRKHEWTDPLLKDLIKWERISVEPKPEEFYLQCLPVLKPQHVLCSANADGMPSNLCAPGDHVTNHKGLHEDIHDTLANCVIQSESIFNDKGAIQYSVSLPAHKVLIALRESTMRRTTLTKICQANLHETREGKLVPVAVLFSGGLDSMILAALLDQCLNSTYEIDLLNVSFDGQLAPDRITAQSGVRELQRIAPSRRWRLVEIDADLSSLTSETKHVTSLINPAKTYMDLNIGIALWLAARGDGWVNEGVQCHKYRSKSKILLVGSGADEQCAGYSRHRTKYRLGGWLALEEEMKLDMQRIWKRNLGRDDRCISDNGKEARFPFLDEDVIRTLLEIPLRDVADLDQPVGRGDKKILREVAWLLGLGEAAVLPKRAIQFGSRIARESNRKNFGSNRAANQASAGSVVIHEPRS